MMYMSVSSTSIAEVMMCLMMCTILKVATLLWDTMEVDSLNMEKWPPVLLRAFGLLTYLAPLWGDKFMLLTFYARNASSCVAK